MRHCDLCGEIKNESDLTTFSPTDIRKAIENGFNPYKAIPKLSHSPATLHAKNSGASDIDIFYNWKTQAMADATNWGICSECTPKLQESLASKSRGPKKDKVKKKVCRLCGKEVPDEITVCPCGSHAFVAVETRFAKKSTEALKKVAGELYAKGQKQAAVEKFKEALLIDPNDASLWSNIGAVLMEVDAADEAARYLKRALKIDPNLGPPQRMLNQIKSHGFDIQSKTPISIEEVSGGSIKSKSGGCFIATACFGSYDSPELLILRSFRDNKLIPSNIGQQFVSIYYAISPPIANIIAKDAFLRYLVRKLFVVPMVKILSKK